MVDIKWRNPYIRNICDINEINNLIDKPRQDILKIREKILEIEDKMDITEKLAKNSRLLQDLDNLTELIKTFHSVSSYKDGTGGLINDIRKELMQRFINCRWSIIQTNLNNQFIVSDNPGIFFNHLYVRSFTSIKQIEELKLDKFFIPLSGLHGLIIQLFVPDRVSTLFEKKIDIIYSPQSVIEYNTCHCVHVNKILIASNKQALKKAWENGKDTWVNKGDKSKNSNSKK